MATVNSLPVSDYNTALPFHANSLQTPCAHESFPLLPPEGCARTCAARCRTTWCRRRSSRWRRCRCRWAPLSGIAASVGGAVPPGGRPYGGGFARGSSGGRRRCPATPHPTGEAAGCCRRSPYAACLRLRCTYADREQQLLLPFLVFASTILTSKFFLNRTHAVQNQSFTQTTWL